MSYGGSDAGEAGYGGTGYGDRSESLLVEPPLFGGRPAPAAGPGPVGSRVADRAGPDPKSRRRSRFPALAAASARWGRSRNPARLGSGPRRTARLYLARHRRGLTALLLLAGLWLTIRSAAPDPPATVTVRVAARDLAAGHTLTGSDLRPTRWPAAAAPGGDAPAGAGQRLASPVRAGEVVTDARVLGPGLLAGQPPGTVALPVRPGDPAVTLLVQPGDRVDVLVPRATVAGGLVTGGTTAGPEPDSTGPAPEPGGEPIAEPGAGPADGAVDRAVDRAGTGTEGGTGAGRMVADALVLAVPGTGGSEEGETGDSGFGGLTGIFGAGGGTAATGAVVLAVSPQEARLLTDIQTDGQLSITVHPRPRIGHSP